MKQYILDRSDPLNPVLEQAPNETVPVYESLLDAEDDLSNLEEGTFIATKEDDATLDIFNTARPIGSVYIQFPQKMSPNDLWGNYSTWEEVDYDGAFFRASGGNAECFADKTDTLSCCLQASDYQCHTHNVISCSTNKTLYGCLGIYQWGNTGYTLKCSGIVNAVAYSGVQGTGQVLSYGGVTLNIDLTHRHRVTIGSTGDSETRPTNYTVKIWVRTA